MHETVSPDTLAGLSVPYRYRTMPPSKTGKKASDTDHHTDKVNSMSTERKYSITLFGATGFTGGLCAEYLASHLPEGTDWAIAGRNQTKLASVCERLKEKGCKQLPATLVADVNNPDSLNAMAADSKLVITTVGPYVYHGEPLVKACAEQGTHYCDLTGEPEFVNNMISRYHQLAKDNGAAIVTCCGFDSIPHDHGVLFTVRELERATGGPLEGRVEIQGVVTANGTFSGGTWESALLAMSRPRENRDAMRRAKDVIDHHYAKKAGSLSQRPRRNPVSGGWLFPMPTIDPVIVQRSARALDCYGPDFRYGHYVGSASLAKLSAGVAGVGGLVLAAQIPPLRRRLQKIRQSGEGPSEEKRAASWFKVTFQGKYNDQEVVCEVAGGDPGYSETAKMLAETAMAMALDSGLPLDTGVITPVMATGDRLIERLQAAGMTFERRQ